MYKAFTMIVGFLTVLLSGVAITPQPAAASDNVLNIDSGGCEGEQCLLHSLFYHGFKESDVADFKVSASRTTMVSVTLDTQTTISSNASMPVISAGDSFEMDINWRGESSAVGVSFYDTPPIIIKSDGTWETALDNIPAYSCRKRDANYALEGPDSLGQHCDLYEDGSYVMSGKWEDRWSAQLSQETGGAWAPTDKITCASNDAGTSALCQASADLAPGNVRVELARILAHPVTLTNGSDQYTVFDKDALVETPKEIFEVKAQSAFPASMVSYADIEIRGGCAPTLNAPASGCLDPTAGIPVSWNTCGADAGTYSVALERQDENGWTPVETKQFEGNGVKSTVFGLAGQAKDGVYKYRIKKTGGGGSDTWNAEEAVTVGVAPGSPSVTAPATAVTGSAVSFSWTHAAADVTAGRIGESVLNIANTLMQGTRTGTGWQSQWTAGAAGNYDYTITSSHPLGCGDGNASGTVEVTPAFSPSLSPTASPDVAPSPTVSVVPTPSGGSDAGDIYEDD